MKCEFRSDIAWLPAALSATFEDRSLVGSDVRRVDRVLRHLESCESCAKLFLDAGRSGGPEERVAEDDAAMAASETGYLSDELQAEVACRSARQAPRHEPGPSALGQSDSWEDERADTVIDFNVLTRDGLSARRSAAVQLCYGDEELNDAEIAARLDSNPAAVREARFQGVKILRARLLEGLLKTRHARLLRAYYADQGHDDTPAFELVERAEARAAAATGLTANRVRDQHVAAMLTLCRAARRLELHRRDKRWRPLIDRYWAHDTNCRPSATEDPYYVRCEFRAMAMVLELAPTDE